LRDAPHAHRLARLVVSVLSFDRSELLLKGIDRIAEPLMQYIALQEFALQVL